ncbi:MAG: toll/interleukin-1 receptor domain-containing protein [Ruminococcus sp.]|uniref:toll/interleukin-1 receptor domain-containing protein n=1 Tax=Ruminococcus sp. TaxID=41978 RepID=UPI002872E268|nr:toll/interleukin-1 receptor domain-containing protein [Ruminococcus sp.]MBQ3285991.1 toll/interleukin-1 receptor domain-containing protein [Ruminococcus sp.]
MSDTPYVFISYSSKETTAAEQLRDVLIKNGFTCWMAPASIEGGSDYTKAIPAAITNCGAVVLVCSENSQNSYWVKSEVIDAISKGKPVIPFIIDRAEMNSEFNFMLSPSQRIIAYNDKAKAYQSLINALNGHFYVEPTDPSVPETPIPATKQKAVQKPVKDAVYMTAEKPTSYSFSTIMIWILYVIGLALFILILSNNTEVKVGNITMTSFFMMTFLMPFTLVCTFIIRRHKTAPVKVIKKRRIIIMMIFIICWVIVETLNLLTYSGALPSLINNDTGFGSVIAVIFISAVAAIIIEIAATASFRKTKYKVT